MKLRDWNCQGLGNTPTVCGLLQCLKSIQVDILCLSKTSLNDRKMEIIRFSLGLSNMVVVKGDGKGGNCFVVDERG